MTAVDDLPSTRRASRRAHEQALQDRFVAALNAAIEAKGIEAQDVAHYAGIDGSAMSLYRNGRRKPSFGRAALFAQILGISIDEIIKEEATSEGGPAEDPDVPEATGPADPRLSGPGRSPRRRPPQTAERDQ